MRRGISLKLICDSGRMDFYTGTSLNVGSVVVTQTRRKSSGGPSSATASSDGSEQACGRSWDNEKR